MSEKHFFDSISTEGSAEFKDRGSRFLAFVFPIHSIEQFKNRLKQLKEEHPKAAHHCFAYRIGTDGNNFRVSDDGEPSGTAGRPILGQIDSKGLTNVAIVVVRYFGGTLLGVPGLINAYKTSTSLVLQVTPVTRKAIEVIYDIEFDYTVMNDVITLLKKFNCTILKQEMQLFCRLHAGIPKMHEELCVTRLREMKGVVVKPSF